MEGLKGPGAGCSTERKKTKMEIAVEDHERAIASLTLAFQDLSGKIVPIRSVRKDPTCNGEKLPPEESKSILVQWVCDQTKSVREIEQYILTVMQEIEL